MPGVSASRGDSRRRWYAVLWGLIALEGGFALVAVLWIPSETGSASLFGYSLSRLALAATILIGIVLFSGVMLASWKNTALWQHLVEITRRFAVSDLRLSILLLVLCGVFGGIVAFFLLAFSPAAHELVILRSLVARLGIALVWVELALIKFGIMLWLSLGDERSRLITPLLGSSLLVIVTGLYTGALKIYMTAM